jgi:hypothetical protein
MLARAVLLWFALYVGVSVAGSVVSPQAFAIICSSTGALMLVDQGDLHGSGTAKHALDCPLCISVAPPPHPISDDQPPAPTMSWAHRSTCRPWLGSQKVHGRPAGHPQSPDRV